MTDLYVETVGDRDAETSLLFMHGPGLDHSYFRPWIDPLSEQFRLVLYDYRLSGRSPRTSTAPLTTETMIEDAIAVIEHSCRGRVIVVAHSWAPWLALLVAAQRPESLAGLILISPGLSDSVVDTLLAHVRQHGDADMERSLLNAFGGQLTSDQEFADAWHTILPLYVASGSRGLRERLFNDTRFSLCGFEVFGRNVVGKLDWQATLRGLRIPLLVISGAQDWMETNPDSGGKAVARLAPRHTFVAISDSGHFPFAEQPEVFRKTVVSWLASLSSSTAT